jgi:hypothetical protein
MQEGVAARHPRAQSNTRRMVIQYYIFSAFVMCSHFVPHDRGEVVLYKIPLSRGVCKIDAALDVHVLSERHTCLLSFRLEILKWVKMNIPLSRSGAALLPCTALFLWSIPALAADPSAAAATPAPAALDEIVVTAQKREQREQREQDVPISLSVMGGADLDSNSITTGRVSFAVTAPSHWRVMLYSDNVANNRGVPLASQTPSRASASSRARRVFRWTISTSNTPAIGPVKNQQTHSGSRLNSCAV